MPKTTSCRTEPAGGAWLKDDDRKTLIEAYQERKRDEIRHPFLDEVYRGFGEVFPAGHPGGPRIGCLPPRFD